MVKWELKFALQKSLQCRLYGSNFLAGLPPRTPLSYVLFKVGSPIVQVTSSACTITVTLAFNVRNEKRTEVAHR